ncbi:hypothetical protein SCLCIDRAFT_1223996 [Scleroderma citrinum Foug A]|uniref:Uncharacterized protein n=1 Tax=Scleroderma citrinum Foug A TaxID=1036808 RepID=A0A0C2YR25_9AGAM|nr:hypothetical protein SCLCIDRAFT_1223996 [Scleroderma citrinum Foug A]
MFPGRGLTETQKCGSAIPGLTSLPVDEGKGKFVDPDNPITLVTTQVRLVWRTQTA